METYKLVSLLCGVVCKLYDDLNDNPLLLKFKNKLLMEILKGLHYIFFISLSLKEPLFFCFQYIANVVHFLNNNEGYSKPYEKSLLYSFPLLLFLVDFKKIKPLTYLDIFASWLFIMAKFIEPIFVKSEYSYYKLIFRIIILLIIFLFCLLPISPILLYIFIYMFGYMLSSVIVQYYSLFCQSLVKHKKKQRKRSKVCKQSSNGVKTFAKSI